MDFSQLIENSTLAFIVTAAVRIIICIVLVSVISKITSMALGRSKLDSGVSDFVSAVIRVVLCGIAVIIVAESFGVPVNSLIAALGVVGLALSLSIQNLLSNMFSGVQIISTRPFSVDDYVEIGNVAGTVSEIRLFQTKLKTSDNRIILVPNGEITASTITNYSMESERRIELRLPLPLSSEPEKIREAILSAVSANERVLKEPVPFVAPDSFMDGRVEYIVRVWARTSDFQEVGFELKEAVLRSLRERGVSLSSQGLSVSLAESNPEGSEIREG